MLKIKRVPNFPSGLSDPYCKIKVGLQRARTKVCPKNLNPLWEEKFSFVVESLDETIRFKVRVLHSFTKFYNAIAFTQKCNHLYLLNFFKLPFHSGFIILINITTFHSQHLYSVILCHLTEDHVSGDGL